MAAAGSQWFARVNEGNIMMPKMECRGWWWLMMARVDDRCWSMVVNQWWLGMVDVHQRCWVLGNDEGMEHVEYLRRTTYAKGLSCLKCSAYQFDEMTWCMLIFQIDQLSQALLSSLGLHNLGKCLLPGFEADATWSNQVRQHGESGDFRCLHRSLLGRQCWREIRRDLHLSKRRTCFSHGGKCDNAASVLRVVLKRNSREDTGRTDFKNLLSLVN